MIKLIAVLIYCIYWLSLNHIKKKKYPKLRNLNISVVKLSIIAAIWSILLGLAGAFKIAYYPKFDPNGDLFLIGILVLFAVCDLVIAGLFLAGKGSWLLSSKDRV